MAVARASSEKKALDIVTIDMRKMSNVCDYFVIASGTSTTQVRAIADNIARRLKEKGQRVWHLEGEREALWILLDCADVVAHIFLDQTRRFYDLERLWAKAPRKRFKEAGPKAVKKSRKAIKPSRRVNRKKATKRSKLRKRR